MKNGGRDYFSFPAAGCSDRRMVTMAITDRHQVDPTFAHWCKKEAKLSIQICDTPL
uniref:Transposase n=1 Tax=Heterorhabditis bacteriophora TaxID=37862 RepID=A0A1I7WH55_HETBA